MDEIYKPKLEILSPYTADIIKYLQTGMSLKKITEALNGRGIEVSYRMVQVFINETKLNNFLKPQTKDLLAKYIDEIKTMLKDGKTIYYINKFLLNTYPELKDLTYIKTEFFIKQNFDSSFLQAKKKKFKKVNSPEILQKHTDEIKKMIEEGKTIYSIAKFLSETHKDCADITPMKLDYFIRTRIGQ